jgi:hypothetical protein
MLHIMINTLIIKSQLYLFMRASSHDCFQIFVSWSKKIKPQISFCKQLTKTVFINNSVDWRKYILSEIISVNDKMCNGDSWLSRHSNHSSILPVEPGKNSWCMPSENLFASHFDTVFCKWLCFCSLYKRNHNKWLDY